MDGTGVRFSRSRVAARCQTRTLGAAAASCLLFLACAAGTEAGSWATTGSLSVARSLHTSTLLPDGRVLAAGGCFRELPDCPRSDVSTTLSSVEVFDPATGTWAPTAPLGAARFSHTATLLPNGKVLVAGGRAGAPTPAAAFASAELYDASTRSWTPTGSMTTARYSHTATLLRNGQVLVAGGGGGGATAELYDPATGIWTPTGALNAGRSDHTATLLADGRVLVAGGDGGGATSEVYDPVAKTWKTTTGGLGTARSRHTATLLPDGKVLVAGGDSSGTALGSSELFDPGTESWTATTGSLSTARLRHAAALLPTGKVLVAAGNSASGTQTQLASAEVYTPRRRRGLLQRR